jgi:hypothetical protein
VLRGEGRKSANIRNQSRCIALKANDATRNCESKQSSKAAHRRPEPGPEGRVSVCAQAFRQPLLRRFGAARWLVLTAKSRLF